MNDGQFTAIMAELRAIRELLAKAQQKPTTTVASTTAVTTKARPPKKTTTKKGTRGR